jgi:hypothetical protein
MLITFLRYISIIFQRQKVITIRINIFFPFCLMIEGSGSGFISLTNGSGCRTGRPKIYGSYGSASVTLFVDQRPQIRLTSMRSRIRIRKKPHMNNENKTLPGPDLRAFLLQWHASTSKRRRDTSTIRAANQMENRIRDILLHMWRIG